MSRRPIDHEQKRCWVCVAGTWKPPDFSGDKKWCYPCWLYDVSVSWGWQILCGRDNEQGDIGSTIAQSRHVQWEHVEPIEEVGAEVPVGDARARLLPAAARSSGPHR